MGVMAMLNLSYIDLPHYLKPCFLHLSLFPEDYVVSSRKLLLLWTAEGFVPEQDDRRMKDVAEVYLNELINRNLILVVRMSVNARVTKCRVHDLVSLEPPLTLDDCWVCIMATDYTWLNEDQGPEFAVIVNSVTSKKVAA
ncbi:unnamed protein product, partial [Vitis vinifera]